MNDNEVLAHALHELADDPQVREIPFPAIKARIGRRRRRVQLALVATAAVAVVATVLTVDGVVRGPQVASAPRTSTTATAVPTVSSSVIAEPALDSSTWPTRGSLAARRDLLEQATQRAVADSPKDLGAGVTGRPLFLGDTAAGRVAVVLISFADTSRVPWVLILAGKSGAPIADLHIVGNVGEPASTSVTRLISTNGGWFLFTLTDPSLTSLDVSWHPVYGPAGIGIRSWNQVGIQDGVSVTAAPNQAIAAKIRLGRVKGQPVLTAPVVQDSNNLNDPSFFPVTLSRLDALPSTVQVDADQVQTVTWLASQLAVVTGFDVAELNVDVLWSAGKNNSIKVIVKFGLPGGATMMAYAEPPISGNSNLLVAFVPAQTSGPSVFAVDAGQKIAVFAQGRAKAAVLAASDGPATVRGTLDAAGGAVLAIPDGGSISAVTVATPPGAIPLVADLTDRPHTDPFDLRP